MKQYESYKDSNIEWLGKIPSHWTPIAMKFYFYMKGRIGWQGLKADEFIEEGPYLVTGTDFENGKVIWERCYHISEERYNEAPEIHVEKGDLLITKDGTVGKLALIDEKPEKVSLNSHLLILRPVKSDVDNHFIYWALQADNFVYYTGLAQNGSIMASLSQEKIGDYKIALPSIAEQQAIDSYLNHKVKQIDAAIAEKEQMLEDIKAYRSAIISEAVTKGLNKKVEMKDSGIEWLGMIPANWECSSLKHFLSQPLQYGANESAESTNPDWPRYIRITDIDEYGNLRVETFKSLDPDKAKDYLLEKGDVLFARSGATVGKTYIFNEDYAACFAGYLIKAKCGKKLLPQFLYLYTNSIQYENWKNSVFIQATIQNIGADKYSLLPIVVPSIEEQKDIIEYANTKLGKLDCVLADIKSQIDDLKAYKSSIITEAVTGKVDLRGWKPNNDKT